jgi:hypothetical protein
MSLDVPIMLVAGKDSFHSEYYSDMVEGTKSRSYNNNESQEETDELIKGGAFFRPFFLSFFRPQILNTHAFIIISIFLSSIVSLLISTYTISQYNTLHHVACRSNPYRSCKVEERRKEATERQTGWEWKVDQRLVILQYSVLYS